MTKLLYLLMAVTLFLPRPSEGEELYVVRDNSQNINDIASLEGVNVYAILENKILIGSTRSRVEDLGSGNSTFQLVEEIGQRIDGRDYFLFQMTGHEIGRLPESVDIVFHDGREAIATVEEGTLIDRLSHDKMRGLTRISFVPKPGANPRTARPSAAITSDPIIGNIVDQVSETEYTAYIQRLQDFVTRYSDTDSCRAAEQWAVDTFTGMGLDAGFFPFDYGIDTWYNAIGRKKGKVYPELIYMIIGHIDATAGNPYVEAPGAEDNASGSSCVLEAARVLSQYDFECTIEFVLVSGEEQGLIGSEAYAQYCLDEQRSILGVFNFDMISYAGPMGWDTNIYADQTFPEEVALANLLGQVTNDYTDAIPVRVNEVGPTYGSDHYYFSLYGFPAPFSIDAQMWGAPDWYPWYHSADDLISHLDLDFGTEVVKGAVAALATLARPIQPALLTFSYPDGIPDTIDPIAGTSFSVEVTSGAFDPEPGTGMLHYSTGGDFTTIPMQVTGLDQYEATLSGFNCGERVSFYLSAQTVGDSVVVTDPPDAPANVFLAFCTDVRAVPYADDFSTDLGWTGLGGPGEWIIDVATGGTGDDGSGGADPSSDHSPSSDNLLLGNDLTLTDGDYEAGLSSTDWVISPTVDCSDYFGVLLNFSRWLGVGASETDHAYLQGFVDSSWTTIFENRSAFFTNDTSWTEMQYDVSEIAAGNPAFQFRFGIGSSDATEQYCGWNIDDIEVVGFSCDTGVGDPTDTGGASIPRTFELSQNYPNPFNPSTTISFDIAGAPGSKERASLVVYDLRGRRVRELIDSELNPGRHEIQWDGRNDHGESMASGIYLYKLRAGGESFTRKMTVLK